MNLVVADFLIQINAGFPLQIDAGYVPYIQVHNTNCPDVIIECRQGLPIGLFDDCKILFEANNGHHKFYTIVRYGEGFGFLIYSQQFPDEIQQIALLDKDLKQWEIYTRPELDGSIDPMKYPMGPIVLYYLVIKNEAIMIHASGIFDGEKGRLFTGFSRTGKSTMAKLWKHNGSTIINDDRLIIRKNGNRYVMHNTPMYYADQPMSASVDAIHLIRHFPKNTTQCIKGVKAVSSVMAFCIQNNFDKLFIQNCIGFISGLCTSVRVYETGFVPDTSIVSFLNGHED